MTDLSRRDLGRLAAALLAGAAFGPAATSAGGVTEIDVPGGRRLLRRLVGDDPEASLERARRVKRGGRPGARSVLALPGGRRLVAEIDGDGYRFTAWSRRLGGITVEGDRDAVRRVVVAPRGRGESQSAYDTLIAAAGGVVLSSSSALAQRELPSRWNPGARLPAEYARFGRSLLARLHRDGEWRQHSRNSRPSQEREK